MYDNETIRRARHRVIVFWLYVIMANVVESKVAVFAFASLAALTAFKFIGIGYKAMKDSWL